MKQSGLTDIVNTTLAGNAPSFSALAWIVFVISFFLFAVISGVLLYHWRTYGLSNQHIIFARTLYLVVAACIVLVAFVSLLMIP